MSLKACIAIVYMMAMYGVTKADILCTATQACPIGCCGKLDPTTGQGYCGLGPNYCGAGNCTSTCDQKSECDPGWGSQWASATNCPLNVCCSQFGFCGTTPDFCGAKIVARPTCSGSSSDGRTIGYYEGWNSEHPCGNMTPDQIPLGYYTHINFAFSLLDPSTFNLVAMATYMQSLYDQVANLKLRQSNLQVWISIGGWTFNDPGATQSTFSNLAASPSAQSNFFNSLISFMKQHNFDGVDIDWEYPGADDRGGVAGDYANYVSFLRNLRTALDNSGMAKRPGLTLTLPSSYWYLRHFDIVSLDPIIDWFNMMTYDIHGTWDANIPSLGNYVKAHTNLTEIEQALDLLWRNNIDPARVSLGLGFYGRSFTLADPNCKSVGCPFVTPNGGGAPGPCTNTSGILSAVEIRSQIANGATVTLDTAAAAEIVTWGTNQWVSYDDGPTLKLKQQYANQRCLGGILIWAIDLDDGGSINALGGNMNRPKAPVADPGLPGGPDLGKKVVIW